MHPDEDLVPRRFARGCRCFTVWIEGAPAGYAWLSTGPEWISEVQLEIKPRPGEAYIWNCVTLTAHRRQGIFRSLLAGVSQIARQEGLRRLWLGSIAIPAEKAVGTSGFVPVLRFNVFQLGGLHVRTVSASSDAALAADARFVLSTGSRIHVGKSRLRRH